MLELENSLFKINLKGDFPEFFALPVENGIQQLQVLEEEISINWSECLGRGLNLEEKNFISATIQMFSGDYTLFQLFCILEIAKIMIHMQDNKPEDL
jgi:hypothetical protein